jgi:AraC family transcriptional activator of tynA and feaB
MQQATWERFSTDSVLPTQRVHRWNDYGSETLCNLTVDPCDRETFQATLSRVEFGPLGLISMVSTGARASSGMGGCGEWAVPEKDALLLVLPEQGQGMCMQNNISIAVEPGDLFFQDLTRPWVHNCPGPMRQLMLKIPFSALLSRVEDPTCLLGVAFSARRPAVAMAADVVRSVHRTLVAEPEGEWHGALSDMVLDTVRLLHQSIASNGGWAQERQQRATVRRDAMRFIINHLDDAELSIASVATALGVGQRRLQRAFIEAGETPSQFILSQRHDRAARELSRAQGCSRGSILDVAFSVGFNDASHFSRSFARRYGVSPRSYKGTLPL